MLKAKSIWSILLLLSNEVSARQFGVHDDLFRKPSEEPRVPSVKHWPGDAGPPNRNLREAKEVSSADLGGPKGGQLQVAGGRKLGQIFDGLSRTWREFRKSRDATDEKTAIKRFKETDPAVGVTPPSPTKQLKFLTELGFVYKIGLPLGFSSAARILQGVTNSIVLGRFNTMVLAAVAVSLIWTQITDNMVFTGILQLSSLCSQAYGAGNKKLVGTWLQIGLAFVTLAGIPIVALRWCTSPILKFLQLKPELADLAGKFTIWSEFIFFFDMWYYTVQRYYAAQMIVIPDAVVDAIFIFVNTAMVYLFVHKLNIGEDGIIGAALGTSLTRLLRLIVYVVYCWGKGFHRGTWFGWSWKEIANRQRWWTFLKMVGPAGLGGLAEQLQFQFCSLLAGRMGPTNSAANNLAVNLLILSFVNAISLGAATSIRMGRLLGSGKAFEARYTSRVGLTACTLGNVVFAALVTGIIGPFSHLASQDVEVQGQLRGLRWTLAGATALLGCLISLKSVLSAQGRPHIAAMIAPVFSWGVGFPVSYISSRTRGLMGIFDGLNAGYSLAVFALMIPYLLSNWPQLARLAQKRNEAKSAGQSTSSKNTKSISEKSGAPIPRVASRTSFDKSPLSLE